VLLVWVRDNHMPSIHLFLRLIYRHPLFRHPRRRLVRVAIVSVHADLMPVRIHRAHRVIPHIAVQVQRSFEPMRHQVELWRQTQLSDDRAKPILYRAFVEGELDAPRSLLSPVHQLYFEPQHEEFLPRTMWSLSNAFTSAFKELDPIPQFKTTARLGTFLSGLTK
jgi:hypothetical protein